MDATERRVRLCHDETSLRQPEEEVTGSHRHHDERQTALGMAIRPGLGKMKDVARTQVAARQIRDKFDVCELCRRQFNSRLKAWMSTAM